MCDTRSRRHVMKDWNVRICGCHFNSLVLIHRGYVDRVLSLSAEVLTHCPNNPDYRLQTEDSNTPLETGKTTTTVDDHQGCGAPSPGAGIDGMCGSVYLAVQVCLSGLFTWLSRCVSAVCLPGCPGVPGLPWVPGTPLSPGSPGSPAPGTPGGPRSP